VFIRASISANLIIFHLKFQTAQALAKTDPEKQTIQKKIDRLEPT
jgi:hypothetical protein